MGKNDFGQHGFGNSDNGKKVFARTDFGKINLAKNVSVGVDNFFTKENIEKTVEEKRQLIQANNKFGQNRYKIRNNNAGT